MKKFIEFVKSMHDNHYSAFVDQLIAKQIPCGLFKPKSTVEVQIDIVNQFRQFGLNMTTIFFSDDNLPTLPEGIFAEVVSPRHKDSDPKFIFVDNNLFTIALFPKLIEYGYEPIEIEPSGTTLPAYNFFMDNIDRIYQVYEQLTDEESKDVLLGYILAQISNRTSFCRYSNNIQYMLEGYLPKSNDVVIDCGVCDGTTSAMFADLGCDVIGFEMDEINYELAKKLADEKNFTVENFGLGNQSQEITYTHIATNIGGSFINSDDQPDSTDEILKTKLITLDSYVQEKRLNSVDFIKMDIEGSELDALKGATNTITRFKPVLALSAYHKLEDIFTLMEFVKSIRSDYEFAFRHYGTTPEIVPYMFPEFLRKFFNKFDLDLKYCHTGELVLFAR